MLEVAEKLCTRIGIIAEGSLRKKVTILGKLSASRMKEEMLAAGRDVILEIEVQGAMKVKEKCPEAVLIFILPPSVGTLRHRLNKRGTETADVVEKRVAEAAGEIAKSVNYDYVVVNDALEEAVDDFITVLKAEKMTVKRSHALIDNILEKGED